VEKGRNGYSGANIRKLEGLDYIREREREREHKTDGRKQIASAAVCRTWTITGICRLEGRKVGGRRGGKNGGKEEEQTTLKIGREEVRKKREEGRMEEGSKSRNVGSVEERNEVRRIK
jgi:hypothetical protein